MLKDNLVLLRRIHGFSQEEIAEKINISRQAYAKWEKGTTIPDIEKCSLLASVYDVTVDSLLQSESAAPFPCSFPVPKNKNIWGSITINDKGQLVIPKEARDKFGLVGGTRTIVLSDENGIALIPAVKFEENIQHLMELASIKNAEE